MAKGLRWRCAPRTYLPLDAGQVRDCGEDDERRTEQLGSHMTVVASPAGPLLVKDGATGLEVVALAKNMCARSATARVRATATTTAGLNAGNSLFRCSARDDNRRAQCWQLAAPFLLGLHWAATVPLWRALFLSRFLRLSHAPRRSRRPPRSLSSFLQSPYPGWTSCGPSWRAKRSRRSGPGKVGRSRCRGFRWRGSIAATTKCSRRTRSWRHSRPTALATRRAGARCRLPRTTRPGSPA